MFKKLGISGLVLGTALTLFGPGTIQARQPEREHHRHRVVGVMLGFGHRHYADGYYDRGGYWHPYRPGYYDNRGRWRAY